MYRGRHVSAIIPCHDEAGFIGRTIVGLPTWVDRIIVVDDASNDGTAEQARALRDPRVEVLQLTHNVGVGGAIVRGYHAVLATDGDLVLVTNGDAQMDGHEVPELLRPLVEDRADLVKGNRLLCPGTRDNIPVLRRAGVHVFSMMTRVATGYAHVGDSQSGYHAVTASALRRLELDSLWPRYGFPNDLLMQAARAGLRVQDRPVRAIYGDEVSGLKVRHAFYPVGWLLLRGMARRLTSR
ncbi:MAG: glycosyltransferase family 2 protein [Myxococcota bacterium]